MGNRSGRACGRVGVLVSLVSAAAEGSALASLIVGFAIGQGTLTGLVAAWR